MYNDKKMIKCTLFVMLQVTWTPKKHATKICEFKSVLHSVIQRIDPLQDESLAIYKLVLQGKLQICTYNEWITIKWSYVKIKRSNTKWLLRAVVSKVHSTKQSTVYTDYPISSWFDNLCRKQTFSVVMLKNLFQ